MVTENSRELLSAFERAKDKRLQTTYGLTLAQWNKMAVAQNGLCAICKRRPKRGLQTDHDHKTGRVRGLLCAFCNYRFLGRGKENPEMHRVASVYLSSDFDGRKL